MGCHIITSQAVDVSLLIHLEILGAKVERVPFAGTLRQDQMQRVARIKKILNENSRIHWMQQYHDAIHCQGYQEVALLIQPTIGVDHLTVIGGVGSGCSTGGLIDSLRSEDPATELIGVQPFGSATFHSQHIEDPDAMIMGTGSAIPFRNVRHELYDRIHWISFEYARSGLIALLQRHAIFAGLSTGCNYLVARYEANRRPDQTFIFIGADMGYRYVKAVYSNHKKSLNIDVLVLLEIASLKDMSFPWSAFDWNRQTIND